MYWRDCRGCGCLSVCYRLALSNLRLPWLHSRLGGISMGSHRGRCLAASGLSPDHPLERTNEPSGPLAWRAEVRRRIESIEKGAVHLIPWERFRAELVARLNAKPWGFLPRCPPRRSGRGRGADGRRVPQLRMAPRVPGAAEEVILSPTPRARRRAWRVRCASRASGSGAPLRSRPDRRRKP